MSTQHLATSTSSSTLVGKKPVVVSSENGGRGGGGKGKTVVGAEEAGRRRAPLGNVTNQQRECCLVPCASAKDIKGNTTSISSTSSAKSPLLTTSNSKPASGLPSERILPKSDEIAPHPVALEAPRSMDISPSPSDGCTLYISGSMSTCESRSSDMALVDENDVAEIKSSESMVSFHKVITDNDGQTGSNVCKGDASINVDEVVNVDHDLSDPQLSATIASDIYGYLRALESLRRPSAHYMEKIQDDINPCMRAILVDWLVEVAIDFKFIHETLFLTIYCIDRYLSEKPVNRQWLQLLGVTCMMIAAKFEEICPPHVEGFCFLTDNSYFKEEVVQMESAVLNLLNFEISGPTTICFVRRFVHVAQVSNEASSLLLDSLCYYLAELSLLDYSMLRYAPSMIAASSVFLAQYIIDPSTRPWNATLRHHTHYDTNDLRDCVTDLHNLRLNNYSFSLPAIRAKYNRHKYKYAAMKSCPPTIPAEYFSKPITR